MVDLQLGVEGPALSPIEGGLPSYENQELNVNNEKPENNYNQTPEWVGDPHPPLNGEFNLSICLKI